MTYQLQRQVTNMRILDSNGKAILVHLTAAVIEKFDGLGGEVPDYMESLRAPPEEIDNYTNGTGVMQHILHNTRRLLRLSDKHIGRAVQSFSSDREAHLLLVFFSSGWLPHFSSPALFFIIAYEDCCVGRLCWQAPWSSKAVASVLQD
jgi:hypothetical protein